MNDKIKQKIADNLYGCKTIVEEILYSIGQYGLFKDHINDVFNGFSDEILSEKEKKLIAKMKDDVAQSLIQIVEDNLSDEIPWWNNLATKYDPKRCDPIVLNFDEGEE